MRYQMSLQEEGKKTGDGKMEDRFAVLLDDDDDDGNSNDNKSRLIVIEAFTLVVG